MSTRNAAVSQFTSPLFAARTFPMFLFTKVVAPLVWGYSLPLALWLASAEIHSGHWIAGLLATLFASLLHKDVIHLEMQITSRWMRYGLDAAKDASLCAVVLLFANFMASYTDSALSTGLMLLWILLGSVGYVLMQLVGLHACLSPALRRKPVRLLFVGIAEHSLEFAHRIRRDPWLSCDFVGFLEDRTADRLPTHNEVILGRFTEIGQIVDAQDIKMVYIALPMKSEWRLQPVLEGVRETTASVYYIHDFLEFPPYNAKMEMLIGVPLFSVCESPFDRQSWLIKELFDRITALMILIVISPLMLTIAVMIKLESPGPVIFRQVRYGINGNRFFIRKFRSMRTDQPASAITQQATKHDPRVTRTGRFLRRSSLDELPQLFNVLTGEMSLVGPRPHAADHNEHYRKIISGYMLRHKINPGITGWAQVNGFRGETDTIEKMADRVKYDLEYLRCWSISLDLLILFKTVGLVLSQKNAY